MPINNLYQDYGVEIAPEGHKHCRPGWVNILCPHCHGNGFHLGYNESFGYFYCFKCGSHPIEGTLIKLFKIPYKQARELASVYKLGKRRSYVTDEKKGLKNPVKIGAKPFKYPSGVGPLQYQHFKYLKKRGYDPEELEELWGLKGTSPTSVLDRIPYSYRIFIPIEWEGKVVSFQCRDFTGKQERYMACPEVREIIHHKHILYGHPSLWEKRRGILVEGATDVWRLGVNACATLGTGYTPEQMKLLARLFTELVIVFDPGATAQRVATKLQEELIFRGVHATVYSGLQSDPGDLSEDDAKSLLEELGF